MIGLFSDVISLRYEADRNRQRKDHKRMTYDCRNAVVRSGERVHCKLGHILSTTGPGGSMGIGPVVKGTTSGACKACVEFKRNE